MDVTVVFLSDDFPESFTKSKSYVYYPQKDYLSPIPMPVMFVSAKATATHIAQALRVDAPSIAAYNQKVDESLMPEVENFLELISTGDVKESLRAELKSQGHDDYNQDHLLIEARRRFLLYNYVRGLKSPGDEPL